AGPRRRAPRGAAPPTTGSPARRRAPTATARGRSARGCRRDRTGRRDRLGSQRLPLGEAFVEAVPVFNRRLAVLPAEVHDLPVPQVGKVDEPGVEVLDDAAEPLDAVHARLYPAAGPLEVGPPLAPER